MKQRATVDVSRLPYLVSGPTCPGSEAAAERMETDRYFNAPRGIGLLWAAVLAGPIAWFLHQQVGYGMATFACGSGGEVGLHVLTGIALLLITAIGAIIAWRSWGRLGREWTAHGGGIVARSRFMAVGGASSAYSFSS